MGCNCAPSRRRGWHDTIKDDMSIGIHKQSMRLDPFSEKSVPSTVEVTLATAKWCFSSTSRSL
eukprot:4320453-Pyramimonas_sp.AAC.1